MQLCRKSHDSAAFGLGIMPVKNELSAKSPGDLRRRADEVRKFASYMADPRDSAGLRIYAERLDAQAAELESRLQGRPHAH
jgi:hypothetical protein